MINDNISHVNLLECYANIIVYSKYNVYVKHRSFFIDSKN